MQAHLLGIADDLARASPVLSSAAGLAAWRASKESLETALCGACCYPMYGHPVMPRLDSFKKASRRGGRRGRGRRNLSLLRSLCAACGKRATANHGKKGGARRLQRLQAAGESGEEKEEHKGDKRKRAKKRKRKPMLRR